jgi:hypothetical protein
MLMFDICGGRYSVIRYGSIEVEFAVDCFNALPCYCNFC